MSRVYGLALLLSIASGMLFGLLPARQIWRTDAARVMKGAPVPFSFATSPCAIFCSACRSRCARCWSPPRSWPLRGMQHSLHAPIGFQPQGAMLASTDMQMAGYSEKDSLPMQKRMLERLSAFPASPLPVSSATRRSAEAAAPAPSIAKALRSSLRLTLRLAQSTSPSRQAT